MIPDGYANYLVQDLGAKGKRALRDWVNAGGRIVAWQGGAEVAAKAGVSTVKFGELAYERARHPDPGRGRRASPLAASVGERDWVMYLDDRTMPPGLGVAGRGVPGRRRSRLRDVRA